MKPASYPFARPRRLRRTASLRALVRETTLTPDHLIAPLFVKQGIESPEPVASMPGVAQHTIASLRQEVKELRSVGVSSFLLFADTCLDEYTSHGHCGPLRDDGTVDNDAANDAYARAAVSQAAAGTDMVAPSGMMDGQVQVIRAALDDAGFGDGVGIMAYCTKYASALYGPFRDAAECAPQFGDRTTYQLDPANADEGVREALADVAEGADVLMVKPAVAYLDLVWRVKQATRLPLAAYHVSGEYAMVHAAAQQGWIDG